MKKRILAIVLALMLALTLLPMGAMADDGIYVSVGGKAFTAFDQTIKIGGGTATLTWEYDDPVLTMNNVNLTSFEKLGSGGGVTYYAAVCFSGNTRFVLKCNNCTITAPRHGSSAVYEGIYTERPTFLSGSLSVKNTDVGIEGSMLFLTPTELDISTVGGEALLASELNISGSGSISLSSVGSSTVTAQSILIEEAKNAPPIYVNLTADSQYGYGDAVAILADGFNCGRSVNVNVRADYSGYKGSDTLLCAGIYTPFLSFCNYSGDSSCRISCNMNVGACEKLAIGGIYTEFLNDNGSWNTALVSTLNISGTHSAAVGIECDNFDSMNAMALESVIRGAAETDIPLVIMTYDDEEFVTNEVYASTDCKSGIAMLLHAATTLRSSDGEELKLHTPKNGMFMTFADEALPVSGSDVPEELSVVVDENGVPANVVVLNNRDYAFNDIDIESQKNFKPAILWAVDKGITAGITPVEFCPMSPCTRGQVVTFLWRAAGKPAPETTENPFVDVSEKSAFYKAILWAYENGIVAGLDSTHFGPSNPCTRGQVVTFLWRYAGKPVPETTENTFTDVKSGPFYNAILWGSENKIVSGYSDNTFRPSNTCTRAQVVTFLYRYLF